MKATRYLQVKLSDSSHGGDCWSRVSNSICASSFQEEDFLGVEPDLIKVEVLKKSLSFKVMVHKLW